MLIAKESLTLESIRNVRFANWIEFVENVTAYPLSQSRSYGSSRTLEGAKPWSGAKTWTEAVERATIGDATLTKELDAHITRAMELVAPATVPEMYLDVTTDYGWDMGTAITGNPQAGINFHMVEGEAKKLVRIVVNNSGSAKVSAAQLMYRGTLAYVLYLTLQSKGYDVSIDLLTCITTKGYRGATTACIAIPLISPGVSLDTAVLAYAVMSPSVFRRLYFGLIDSLGNEEVWNKYGPYSSYAWPTLIEESDKGDITIDGNMTDTLSGDNYEALVAHAGLLAAQFEQGE